MNPSQYLSLSLAIASCLCFPTPSHGEAFSADATISQLAAQQSSPRSGRIAIDRVQVRNLRATNGFSMSWDGRLAFLSPGYMGTPGQTDFSFDDPSPKAASRFGQWEVRVLRPEGVSTSNAGAPVFGANALSDPLSITMPSAECTQMLNYAHTFDPTITATSYFQYLLGAWGYVAVVSTPGLAANPYASDVAGNALANGTFKTYLANIFSVSSETMVNQPTAAPANGYPPVVIPSGFYHQQLGFRTARIVVANPNSINASVQSAQAISGFQPLITTSGGTLRGIEPSLTADGMLLVYQGNPTNDGYAIGDLMYSWNTAPGMASGWSPPKPLAQIASDGNVLIGGLRLSDRYGVARAPLLDFNRTVYGSRLLHGAYPWIDPDGKNIFFTTMFNKSWNTRRSGYAVIGEWTNWALSLIDGPINPNRNGSTVTDPAQPNAVTNISPVFFSSAGAFHTMWAPYQPPGNTSLPYGTSRHLLPLFGGPSASYDEVDFDPYLDHNYMLYLRMNEGMKFASSDPTAANYNPASVDADGVGYAWDTGRTFDVSGNANHGALVNGAQFPFEYFNGSVDQNVGAMGQAVYFQDSGAILVADSPTLALDTLLTGQAFVKLLGGHGWQRNLLMKSGQFAMAVEANGLLSVQIVDKNGGHWSTSGGPVLPIGTWTHVAFTYDGSKGVLNLFVDAKVVASLPVTPGSLAAGHEQVVIGPANTPAQYPGLIVVELDEVALSAAVRSTEELANAALLLKLPRTSVTSPTAPAGLQTAPVYHFTQNTGSAAAVRLGYQLFNEKALSPNGKISCASCHQSSAAFADSSPLSTGVTGATGSRHAPSLLNRAFSEHQMWDRRSASLEEQVFLPLENPTEMGMPRAAALAFLSSQPAYVKQFNDAFGQAPTEVGLAFALSSYLRTLVNGGSRVDSFQAGNADALSPAEQRGLVVFQGKGKCLNCHNGPNYTDELAHATRLLGDNDGGVWGISGRASDIYAFKTPSLRGIVDGRPFLHNGSVNRLSAVVALYNAGGLNSASYIREIGPLGLTTQEQDDLVTFLEALSGTTKAPVPRAIGLVPISVKRGPIVETPKIAPVKSESAVKGLLSGIAHSIFGKNR